VNELYEWCKDVNQGTYGYNYNYRAGYKARCKKTDEVVALKKIKQDLEKDGVILDSINPYLFSSPLPLSEKSLFCRPSIRRTS
jgi:hypothetical protein